MVEDKWHSINGEDKYGSVFYLKTGGPCFKNNAMKKQLLLCLRFHPESIQGNKIYFGIEITIPARISEQTIIKRHANSV
ncbi:hypothetical protein BpHYR1_050672 [Brachionus plicatilis]|uniref:Uncharacterized protein n=1 Tax=Brachionus plicatilis TaxID=10195 RepID=A0A3M7SM47_BRAPC|nr:hypothetical protein BpHYR1_050672 [Brachionus plicatilis]